MFFFDTLQDFNIKKKYDTIFTSHTNYYWASDKSDYEKQLIKLTSLLKKDGKLIILTLPKESDHYNIMLRQVYPEFNYSKYIINFYRKEGFNVEVKRFKMRMYIGDILQNKHFFDLNNFYRFVHNTERDPNREEGMRFLGRIKEFQKKGYLDFKDELIIVS